MATNSSKRASSSTADEPDAKKKRLRRLLENLDSLDTDELVQVRNATLETLAARNNTAVRDFWDCEQGFVVLYTGRRYTARDRLAAMVIFMKIMEHLNLLALLAWARRVFAKDSWLNFHSFVRRRHQARVPDENLFVLRDSDAEADVMEQAEEEVMSEPDPDCGSEWENVAATSTAFHVELPDPHPTATRGRLST